MIKWITGIGGLILGSGVTGLIQYFCNRRDSEKERTRKNLGEILRQLSKFGNSLHKAYNDWCDNLNRLGPLLEEHVEYWETYKQDVDNIYLERNKIVEKYRSCICEHAPNCPHRVVGEESYELDDLLEMYKQIEATYVSLRKEFIDKCIEIIDTITPSLSEYADFLSHVPEAYMLKSKLFNKIHPFLYTVEQSNTIISNKIRLIRTEPEYFGDKDRNLRQPILNAIDLVEVAKLRINQILTDN